MRKAFSTLIAVLALGMLAVPATASAAAADAETLRSAVSGLWQAKQAAKPAQAALLKRAAKQMAKCKRRGKGWTRIRKLREPAQRRLLRGGARILWKDLYDLAQQRARLLPLRGAMTSYVNRIERAGISDPVLLAGVAAQRRRLGIQEGLVALGSCKVFESRLKKIRAVRRKGLEQAHFDAEAGAAYSAIARYIEKKRIAAENSYFNQLEAAYDRLIALGAKEGDANGFLYALSLAR